MLEGTVVFYNPARKFGFIEPVNGGEKVFFHYSKGSLDGSVRRVPVPVPQRGDRVVYAVHDVLSRATIWWFADIKERLNTLTPDQQQLMRQVLGSNTDQWEIWNAHEEIAAANRYEGREWFGAHKTGPGPRGTFYQVLLWARYYLAERGVTEPALPRWPDMPRYSVRIKVCGQWNAINMPFYTRVQADVFLAHLCEEGRYDDVRVVDLWPDAPPLTVGEARKVLAACGRDALRDYTFGDSEVSWHDTSWGRNTMVANGYFGTDHAWVALNGHTYRDEEARQLKNCGPVLKVSLNH